MILIDFQQTAIANAVMDSKNLVTEEYANPDKSPLDRLREMLVRAIRSYRTKFHSDYGEIVLCCDSPQSWRKDVFPFYKLKRRKKKDESGFDWKGFHDNFTIIKEEFKVNLPYKLIEAEGAEGDDIIGLLCAWNELRPNPENMLIYSSDKDFKQLQRYPHVKQWDKFKEIYIVSENWEHDLKEHIIRGDVDDGIPNILSPDNVFAVSGQRQKPIYTKKIDEWKLQDPTIVFEGDDLERYNRNQLLIDLSRTPADVKKNIVDGYIGAQPGKRRDLHKYFLSHNLVELVSDAGAF